MTAWSDLVQSTFKSGRQNNQSYQLKDAMQDAKAVYKQGGSGSCGLMKGGEAKLEGGNPLKMNMGGKKKRTLKKQKKSKKGKKSRRH
jgi:hypothetical protein